jgi:hypothetical protein
MSTLRDFVVIQKLTVHTILVETKRVRAIYTATLRNGRRSDFEFIFAYDRALFDANRAEDINLASMMLVQSALNYGLFCENIEFDGLFDTTDQRFILDMIENTSREIVTNKLLIENEFIKADFAGPAIAKQRRYTQAQVHFHNSNFAEKKLKRTQTVTYEDKYAILSSGGKDSLLTYGLVREFGDPYPVFINEAGRHWFTAVNAHRYFSQHEKNTYKPWTNCDRLFNWMLKQLPFIRENYASIRADIYPVRLWTVAVFLFGVLPIARHLRLGNILIGNEYDTTVRGVSNGITHYNGLFDQSKHFDNAMTRYYRRKGWHIYQYSMLRSLSELLIMKILLRRYPELQRHQVSCHAAHAVDERMYPCGKCEKCRRIIGMVKALGADPGNCGYNAAQIADGLKALASKSVKQIGSDAAHLYHLLLNKGLVESNAFTRNVARNHPEILKLRFDRERSVLADLPGYVRKPLFDILQQYADGAVKRTQRRCRPVAITNQFLHESEYVNHER